MIKKNFRLLSLLTINNNQRSSSFWKKKYPIESNVRNMIRPFLTIPHFVIKTHFSYPYESDNTMLFPMFLLALFTLFVGFIGIPFNEFNQQGIHLDILDKWLNPSINLLHQSSNNSENGYEFLKNATFSVSIAYFGIFIASFFYKPAYSSLQNFYFRNSFVKSFPTKIILEKIINVIYDWSYNRGYIDAFYRISLIGGIRGLAELTHFFDRRVIDGITNVVGIINFFVGESIKYIGGGRISSYILLYLSYVLIFLLIYYFLF